MRSLKTAFNVNTEYDAIEALIRQFVTLSKELFPEKTDIVKNLEKVKIDLQVLVSF